MPKLYIVGTPIGNLGDFSPRAVEVLRACDFIAAEDTRVTAKLLHKFEIQTPMLSYHEHNKTTSGARILSKLQAGQTGALVTDAGMPAISDPGEALVRSCHENGIIVESVPGPTAFATALALSGMPAGRFCFEGFLSMTKRSRVAHLQSLEDETRTMIFYEAPHKLPQTLKDFAAHFGPRPLAIVRELTKLHEEVIHTNCEQAAQDFSDRALLKGEIVLIVAGAEPKVPEPLTLDQAVALAKEYIDAGETTPQAAKRAAKESRRRKNEIYAALTKI